MATLPFLANPCLPLVYIIQFTLLEMGCWWMVRVSKQPKADKTAPSIPPHQAKVSTQVWKAQCKKMVCLCPHSPPTATTKECSALHPRCPPTFCSPISSCFSELCVRGCRKLLNEAFSFNSKGWLTHTISRRQRFKKAKFWNCFLLSLWWAFPCLSLFLSYSSSSWHFFHSKNT